MERGHPHPHHPRNPTRLTGAVSPRRAPLASETPPAGTPWWQCPRGSPANPPARGPGRPRPGSRGPPRPGPAPQLRSGGTRLRVPAAQCCSGLSVGAGRSIHAHPTRPHPSKEGPAFFSPTGYLEMLSQSTMWLVLQATPSLLQLSHPKASTCPPQGHVPGFELRVASLPTIIHSSDTLPV